PSLSHPPMQPFPHPSLLLPFPTRRSSDLPQAPIAQLAEADGLKPFQCRFESDWGHRSIRSTFLREVFPKVLSKWLVDGIHVGSRSEEHTSELQSRFDLVCRLLLEKKK